MNALKQAPVEREWLGYGEARRLVGLSRSTLYKLVKRGEVKAARIGRLVKINRASLEEYMELHIVGGDEATGDSSGENAMKGFKNDCATR